MRNNRRKNGDGGFTLLELLLALSITAVIIVLIFGTFRISIRAWERGERDIEQHQRTRIVLDLMRKQLASISPVAIIKKEKARVAFYGDAAHIAFVSKVALNPANRYGDVVGQYQVETDQDRAALVLTEKDPMTTTLPVDVDTLMGTTAQHVLIEDAASIAFDFLKQFDAEGNPEWLTDWRLASGLPLAVRVRLVEQADESPIVIIVPIRSQGEPL